MNEPNPPIPPIEAAPLPAYKDRSTGLVIFGILTLLLGCLAGLFVPLMLFGQMMAARAPNAPPVNHAAMLPGMAVYGLLAVALIWLGIGSIKARRWARALLLIFSWSWLIMGVCMTAVMPFVMSKAMANLPPNAKTGQPAMPPVAITGMVIGMTLFFFVIFVVVPAVWTFFYNSRHVKATSDADRPAGHAAGGHHRHGHRHDPFLLRDFCRRAGGVDVLLQQPPCEGHLRGARPGDALDGCLSAAGAGVLPVDVAGRADDAGHVADRSGGDAVLWGVRLRPAGCVVLSGHRRHLGHGGLVVIPAGRAGLVAHSDRNGAVHGVRPDDVCTP